MLIILFIFFLFILLHHQNHLQLTFLKRLKVIQPIIRRYETQGSSPILVVAEDFNQWVCKYRDENKLFNEFLSAEFAKLWGINIPENALIEIDYDKHIKNFSNKRGLERKFFDKDCFGSLHLKDSLEVNDSFLNDKSFVRKIRNKDVFLKIALFDIWLSNEDRNSGNYNLLLNTEKGGYTLLYVIDHADIFNSSMAYINQNEIEILTEEDTILNSKLSTLLLSNETQIAQKVDDLLRDFRTFVDVCKNNLSDILSQVPVNWKINLQQYQSKVEDAFSEKWLDICDDKFRYYVQQFIIKKR